MIPYNLIVPSASRPHLLRPTLYSLLENADQLPERIFVHDDAVFPGKQGEICAVLDEIFKEYKIEMPYLLDDPPISHGPALGKLLSLASSASFTPTEFVLYTQDDLLTIRPIPISRALATMRYSGLHQVRFNKRATMGWKGGWPKKEYTFLSKDHTSDCLNGATLRKGELGERSLSSCQCGALEVLTVSDHWYFQTGLWRRERIKAVVDWWLTTTGESFREHCEPKINKAMNGEVGEFNRAAILDTPPGGGASAMDQDVRASVQRTFIWGNIGDDRYIDNLGADPKDWALFRPRGGVTGPGSERDSQANEGKR